MLSGKAKDGAGAAGAVGLVDSAVFISATMFDHLNFSSSMFKLHPTNRLLSNFAHFRALLRHVFLRLPATRFSVDSYTGS